MDEHPKLKLFFGGNVRTSWVHLFLDKAVLEDGRHIIHMGMGQYL